MTEPENTELPEARSGDPLHDLWHWSKHPVARTAIIAGVLIATLVAFTLLAQFVF